MLRSFADLPIDERAKLLKERLKKYCQKACPRILTWLQPRSQHKPNPNRNPRPHPTSL